MWKSFVLELREEWSEPVDERIGLMSSMQLALGRLLKARWCIGTDAPGHCVKQWPGVGLIRSRKHTAVDPKVGASDKPCEGARQKGHGIGNIYW